MIDNVNKYMSYFFQINFQNGLASYVVPNHKALTVADTIRRVGMPKQTITDQDRDFES